MEAKAQSKYRTEGGREVTFDSPLEDSPDLPRHGSKRRWGVPTPRGHLSTRSLVKELKRSMSDFVGPFFSNSHFDASNKVFDSLCEDSQQAPSTRRSRASQYLVQRTQQPSFAMDDGSPRLAQGCLDPFVTPTAFRDSVLPDDVSGDRSRLSKPAEEEDYCRKELASSELSLERLQGEIAARLSIAQSLADECRTSRSPRQSAVQFFPAALYGPWQGSLLAADGLGAVERCEVLLRGAAVRGSHSADSPAYVMEEDDRPYDIDYLGSRSFHRTLSRPSSSSSVQRSPVSGPRPSDAPFDHLSNPSLSPPLSLGSLSACLAMSVDRYPSRKETDIEYIDALMKLPVLCFVGSISLSDVEALPNLKQDSKDLTRDVVCINGVRVPGVAGYRHVYQRVARELLPPELRRLYSQVACDKDALQQSCSSSDGLLSAMAPSAEGLQPSSAEPLEIKERLEPMESPKEINALKEKESSKEMEDAFCRAELQALMLLHFVNRTLAGGHGFEKVLSVFGNEKLSLIVPNSKAAQPLDVILPQCHEGKVAILRSHTSFRIFAAGSSPEPMNRYADIDSYFMADIQLASALDDGALGRACAHIVEDTELQSDDIKPLLPNRLMDWMSMQAKDMSNQPSEERSLNAIHYRIYLNCHTAPEGDA